MGFYGEIPLGVEYTRGITQYEYFREVDGSNPLGVADSNFLLALGLYPVFAPSLEVGQFKT